MFILLLLLFSVQNAHSKSRLACKLDDIFENVDSFNGLMVHWPAHTENRSNQHSFRNWTNQSARSSIKCYSIVIASLMCENVRVCLPARSNCYLSLLVAMYISIRMDLFFAVAWWFECWAHSKTYCRYLIYSNSCT